MQPNDPGIPPQPGQQAVPPGYGQPPTGDPGRAGYPKAGYGQPAGYPPAGYGQPGAAGVPPGYPAQPRPRRPLLPLGLGDAMTAFGGLLVFAFSFAPFVSYHDHQLVRQLERENLPSWFSAWGTETFMAPLTWFIALSGLLAVGFAGLRLVVPRDAERYTFRTGHGQLAVTLFALVTLFGYGVSAKYVIFGHDLGMEGTGSWGQSLDMSLGWGGYLMLFGSLVATVGAVLSHFGIGPTVYPMPARPVAAYPPAPGQQMAPQSGQYGAAPYADSAAATAAYPTIAAPPNTTAPQNPPAPQSAPPHTAAAPQSAPPQNTTPAVPNTAAEPPAAPQPQPQQGVSPEQPPTPWQAPEEGTR